MRESEYKKDLDRLLAQVDDDPRETERKAALTDAIKQAQEAGLDVGPLIVDGMQFFRDFHKRDLRLLVDLQIFCERDAVAYILRQKTRKRLGPIAS